MSHQHHQRIRGRKGVAIRKRVKAKQPLCAICAIKGLVVAARHVDHVIPLSKGGTNDDSNLMPLCVPCHEAKTARDKGHRPRRRYGADGWPIDE
jgi:5-methylcytosine-specific restriction protein A